MNAVGIVAEYNPFHTGHRWQIEETRRRLGQDWAVVCAMSGNWVQRGECAVTDKWTRARMALEGGADLVLELPQPWALSSAEGFARGAVGVLKATGVVEAISFGSESGDGEALKTLAEALDSKAYEEELRKLVGKGLSFPEARQRAVTACLGKKGELLRGPNDNLAVEYLRAAGPDLRAIALPRQGSGHNGTAPVGGYASASYLREKMIARVWEEVCPFLPEDSISLLQGAGTANMERLERAVLARLRTMDEEAFARLPDSGAAEGLPARLAKAADRAESLERFYTLAKTRRYTHARIRRLALWAFLGMEEKDRPNSGPAYLRVLGMNDRGKILLREMKKRASLPVLTKPAHVKELGEEAQRLFSLESRGTDLFQLCFDMIRPCGMEYTTGPVRI